MISTKKVILKICNKISTIVESVSALSTRVDDYGDPVSISKGGTGATTAADARANLEANMVKCTQITTTAGNIAANSYATYTATIPHLDGYTTYLLATRTYGNNGAVIGRSSLSGNELSAVVRNVTSSSITGVIVVFSLLQIKN